MKDLDFTGKTALVVGGSSGIGNGIARAFRDRGARVHVTGTRQGPEAYADDDYSDLTGMGYSQLDVGDQDAIAAFDPGLDRLDVLVESAAIVLYKRQEFEPEGFRKVVDVNLNAVMEIGMKFHPLLKASGGSFIILGSVASFVAVPWQPAYSATKGAIRTLTKSLAVAWARDGIRVNAIAPGPVRTRMTEISHENEAVSEKMLMTVPLKRWGEPEDIAGPAVFLASPLAAYMTGQTIPVDGGQTCGTLT